MKKKLKQKRVEITIMKIEINDRVIAKILRQATIKNDRQLALYINRILKGHISGAFIHKDFLGSFFED